MANSVSMTSSCQQNLSPGGGMSSQIEDWSSQIKTEALNFLFFAEMHYVNTDNANLRRRASLKSSLLWYSVTFAEHCAWGQAGKKEEKSIKSLLKANCIKFLQSSIS